MENLKFQVSVGNEGLSDNLKEQIRTLIETGYWVMAMLSLTLYF